MKIHIVKKGDTLWKIAEMYDVDFEDLKQMNAHLAHPDMIMPGMKIRIPVKKKESKKETKKEHIKSPKEQPVAPKKETKKTDQQPKKEITQPQQTKPIEKVKEDDYKDHIHIQPVIPFEQQKSPSLNKNTMPKMPSMPELPHISPVKKEKEKVKVKEQPKAQIKQEVPSTKEKKEEMKEEVESIPLTSHGCQCYCGTCTPMHFAGAQMVPKQHMHMMYPSQGCGCQQQGMYGNNMHHPMVQGAYMPYPHMQYMHPTHYQMMDGNHMYPHMMQQPMEQPYHESPAHMNEATCDNQWPQQEYYSNDNNWRQGEEQERSEAEDVPEEQSIGDTYPPMYSEESSFYSYPEPPEISEE